MTEEIKVNEVNTETTTGVDATVASHDLLDLILAVGIPFVVGVFTGAIAHDPAKKAASATGRFVKKLFAPKKKEAPVTTESDKSDEA